MDKALSVEQFYKFSTNKYKLLSLRASLWQATEKY